jgi:hypothetical protein
MNRPSSARLQIALALVVSVAASLMGGEGARWYVDASRGDDTADGKSAQTAFKTLARGFKALKGGETLVVGPGVYYEGPLTVEDFAGTAAQPTWIVAEPRGQATISAAWKEAALGQVKWADQGNGVYAAPRAIPPLFGWIGERGFLFRYLKLDHLRAAKAPIRGRKTEVNGPEHGFAWEDGKLYLKLPGGADPNGKSVMFSRPSWGERGAAAVLRLQGSPHVIVDGFRVQGSGTYGIQFDAPNATVRNCVFEYCREGVGVKDDSLVEWCEYSYPGFYELAEESKARNNGKVCIYPLTKEYHTGNWFEGSLAYPDTDAKDPAPKRVEVRYCYAHDCFDGLEMGGWDDSEAHHNVFLHCYDNCVEMETWTENHSRNLRFHHNLLLSCPAGPMSHQVCNDTQKLEGPHYVYRNVICGYDDHGWNPWVVIKSKCHDIKGLYYYHNLVLVESGEPYWNEKDWPQEWLKNTAFKNNIFVFTKRLKRPTGPRGSEALFQASNNIIVSAQADPEIRDKLLGADGKFFDDIGKVLLNDPAQLDFGLKAGSPAIDAGCKLPGFNDDAKGAAPDIGPFEFDEQPGADWPRPRQTAFDANPPEAIAGKKLPPKVVIAQGK